MVNDEIVGNGKPVVEAPKSQEDRLSEARSYVVDLITDERISVGKNVILNGKRAMFNLDVSKLTFSEVMQLSSKLNSSGLGVEYFPSGSKNLVVSSVI